MKLVGALFTVHGDGNYLDTCIESLLVVFFYFLDMANTDRTVHPTVKDNHSEQQVRLTTVFKSECRVPVDQREAERRGKSAGESSRHVDDEATAKRVLSGRTRMIADWMSFDLWVGLSTVWSD